MAVFDFCHLFRSAFRHDESSAHTAFRSQIDHIIGALDHIHVVFDNDHRMTFVNQRIERAEKYANVIKMQPCCRLVEDIQDTFLLFFPQV